MDKYDAAKRIALMVDEWGTWWDVEQGTNPGFLYQQNTMRDAFVAALSLDIFNKHSERVQMANIAQVANVLQSMALTKDDKMVLTPTYYVFEMYKAHQDAVYIPLEISAETMKIREKDVTTVSATASKKNGAVSITLSNFDLEKSREVTIDLADLKAKTVSGRILTSKNINDHNTFDKPETVKPQQFNDFKLVKNTITVKLPAKAIVALEIK